MVMALLSHECELSPSHVFILRVHEQNDTFMLVWCDTLKNVFLSFFITPYEAAQK